MMERINDFLAIAAAIHAVAVVIVNCTETPRDDEAVARVYRVVEVIAGLVGPRAKR